MPVVYQSTWKVTPFLGILTGPHIKYCLRVNTWVDLGQFQCTGDQLKWSELKTKVVSL